MSQFPKIEMYSEPLVVSGIATEDTLLPNSFWIETFHAKLSTFNVSLITANIIHTFVNRSGKTLHE